MYGLYDHQSEAVEKLKNGSILCAEVGTGKSRTAIAYYLYKECECDEKTAIMKNPKDLYIITTAKKRDSLDWCKECAPYSLSSDPECNINHVKIVVDSWNNIEKYINVENAFFIFDEQRVIGYGVWTKSFLKITKKNHWILLSATPADTWSDYIPVFIANGFYKNKYDFSSTHIIYDAYRNYPKIDRYVGYKRLIKNRDSILVPMNFKKLTKSFHKDVIVDYDKSQYDEVRKNRWNIYENKPIETAASFCYILRRVVNENDCRLEAMENILVEDCPKAIIFYNFDYELEMLRSWCLERGYAYAEWNGHLHEEIPKEDSWLYLVQYSAGAEGWNCIETNVVIFFSQHYSYRCMIQSAGRIDRMNTPFSNLYYYHIRTKSPIDMAIKRALDQKKSFNASNFIRGGIK